MYKLNEALKREWVATLRSGKYEQGRMFLNSHGKFCCLGVLCEIVGLPKRPWLEDNQPETFVYQGADAGWEEGCMPALDEQKFGKDVNAALWQQDIEINGKRTSLAQHNDNGQTFAEIADAIEEQL